MIKLGFSTIACPDYNLDQIIDLGVTSGLPGVELRFINDSTEFDEQPEFAPEALAATRARFEDAGLDVVTIDTSLRMSSLD